MESIAHAPGDVRLQPASPQALAAAAFDCIFETHYRRVYNFVAYRINNHHDAEELVSQVFEKVIVKYGAYDPERSPMEAWIIGIAKNVVNDYFRGVKRRNVLFLDNAGGDAPQAPELVDQGLRPEEIALRGEEHASLMKALYRLTDKERTVVAMKYAAGLKNTEIAALMELSEANTGVILHRSLKKLRKFLESEEAR